MKSLPTGTPSLAERITSLQLAQRKDLTVEKDKPPAGGKRLVLPLSVFDRPYQEVKREETDDESSFAAAKDEEATCDDAAAAAATAFSENNNPLRPHRSLSSFSPAAVPQSPRTNDDDENDNNNDYYNNETRMRRVRQHPQQPQQPQPQPQPAELSSTFRQRGIDWPETDSWARWSALEGDEKEVNGSLRRRRRGGRGEPNRDIQSSSSNSSSSSSGGANAIARSHSSNGSRRLRPRSRERNETESTNAASASMNFASAATSSGPPSVSMTQVNAKIDHFLHKVTQLAPPAGASSREAADFTAIRNLAATREAEAQVVARRIRHVAQTQGLPLEIIDRILTRASQSPRLMRVLSSSTTATPTSASATTSSVSTPFLDAKSVVSALEEDEERSKEEEWNRISTSSRNQQQQQKFARRDRIGAWEQQQDREESRDAENDGDNTARAASALSAREPPADPDGIKSGEEQQQQQRLSTSYYTTKLSSQRESSLPTRDDFHSVPYRTESSSAQNTAIREDYPRASQSSSSYLNARSDNPYTSLNAPLQDERQQQQKRHEEEEALRRPSSLVTSRLGTTPFHRESLSRLSLDAGLAQQPPPQTPKEYPPHRTSRYPFSAPPKHKHYGLGSPGSLSLDGEDDTPLSRRETRYPFTNTAATGTLMARWNHHSNHDRRNQGINLFLDRATDDSVTTTTTTTNRSLYLNDARGGRLGISERVDVFQPPWVHDKSKQMLLNDDDDDYDEKSGTDVAIGGSLSQSSRMLTGGGGGGGGEGLKPTAGGCTPRVWWKNEDSGLPTKTTTGWASTTCRDNHTSEVLTSSSSFAKEAADVDRLLSLLDPMLRDDKGTAGSNSESSLLRRNHLLSPPELNKDLTRDLRMKAENERGNSSSSYLCLSRGQAEAKGSTLVGKAEIENTEDKRFNLTLSERMTASTLKANEAEDKIRSVFLDLRKDTPYHQSARIARYSTPDNERDSKWKADDPPGSTGDEPNRVGSPRESIERVELEAEQKKGTKYSGMLAISKVRKANEGWQALEGSAQNTAYSGKRVSLPALPRELASDYGVRKTGGTSDGYNMSRREIDAAVEDKQNKVMNYAERKSLGQIESMHGALSVNSTSVSEIRSPRDPTPRSNNGVMWSNAVEHGTKARPTLFSLEIKQPLNRNASIAHSDETRDPPVEPHPQSKLSSHISHGQPTLVHEEEYKQHMSEMPPSVLKHPVPTQESPNPQDLPKEVSADIAIKPSWSFGPCGLDWGALLDETGLPQPQRLKSADQINMQQMINRTKITSPISSPMALTDQQLMLMKNSAAHRTGSVVSFAAMEPNTSPISLADSDQFEQVQDRFAEDKPSIAGVQGQLTPRYHLPYGSQSPTTAPRSKNFDTGARSLRPTMSPPSTAAPRQQYTYSPASHVSNPPGSRVSEPDSEGADSIQSVAALHDGVWSTTPRHARATFAAIQPRQGILKSPARAASNKAVQHASSITKPTSASSRQLASLPLPHSTFSTGKFESHGAWSSEAAQGIEDLVDTPVVDLNLPPISERSDRFAETEEAAKPDTIRNYWQNFSEIKTRGSFDSVSLINADTRWTRPSPLYATPLRTEKVRAMRQKIIQETSMHLDSSHGAGHMYKHRRELASPVENRLLYVMGPLLSGDSEDTETLVTEDDAATTKRGDGSNAPGCTFLCGSANWNFGFKNCTFG